MQTHSLHTSEDHFRVFLACPITDLLNPQKGNLPSHYETFIKCLHAFLKQRSDSVFLALEREEWGANLMEAEICTPLDYKEMQACTAVVAYPGESRGVAVELGWASALRKPLILLLEEGVSYTPMIDGLDRLPNLVVHKLRIPFNGHSWDLEAISPELDSLLASIRLQKVDPAKLAI